MHDQNTPIEATIEQTAAPTLESVVEAALSTLPIDVTLPKPAEEDGALVVMGYKEEHAMKLAVLANDVKALPVITDTKARDVNQKMKTRLVNTRNDVNRSRLAMFEPVRALKAKVDEYLGTTPDAGLQGQLKELENQVSAKIDAWDRKVEDERIAAANALRERNTARAKTLLSMHFNFDGGGYSLYHSKEHNVLITEADVRGFTDEQWEEFITKKAEPISKMIRDIIEETDRRVGLLKEAGMTQNPVTGHYEIADQEAEGGEFIVMREELDVWPMDEFVGRLTRVMGLKEENDAREAAAAKQHAEEAEMHEQMKKRFEDQARKERENDEARMKIDAEREALKFEKIDARAEQLEEIGVFPAEASEGVVFDINGTMYPKHTLADHVAIAWQGILGDARAFVAARIERMNTQDARGKLLMGIPHAKYDGDSVWTLGKASVTDHALATMTDEQWAHVLDEFVEANNAVDRAAPVEVEAPNPTTTLNIAIPNVAETERMHAVLIDAEALLTSLGAAVEATTSAIAKQTYERALGPTQIIVDNLRGTMKKDL